MKTTILNLPFLSFLLLLLYGNIQAQSTTQPVSFSCGTENLTLQQKQELQRQMEIALQHKNKSLTGITYVPIRPHIIRRSDGTGDFGLAELNAVIAGANSQFLQNGSGIQFYFCGSTPNYIDNDDYYNSTNLGFLSPIVHDAYNALNQYYVQQLGDIDGFASIPIDHVTSTRSVIRVSSGNLTYIGKQLIAHELGHSFNLFHTFTSYSGTTQYTDELVTRGPGANCDSAGDLVCDTPADPFFMPGAQLIYPNGCPEYNPASTARDANGDPYAPSTRNIMSYYFHCTPEFSPGQYDRIQGGLAMRQSHTNYSIDCPATNVTAPSNLIAYTAPTLVTLHWQDNANNEMGYFIERSTDPNSGFVPIGGVAPNAITFTDTDVTANTQYYYRLRPSNTTTGNFSPTAPAFTTACHPTFENGCSANDGLASVMLNNLMLSQNSGCSVGSYGQFTTTTANATAGQPFPFSITLLGSGHAQGVTIWADLNRSQTYDLGENLFISPSPTTGTLSGTLVIPENTAPGPLAIRIIAAYNTIPFYPCDPYNAGETEDYQLNLAAPAVTGLTTIDITGTSALLNWNSLGTGVPYDIQWRVVGSPTWNTYLNYYSTTYPLYSLSVNTVYEWQVRRAGSVTYSGPVQFTTPCPTPQFLGVAPARTSAIFYWVGQTGQTYTFRWRPTGSSAWNTINNLTTTYSLTGLTASTSYEWSVQAICSASVSSAFSDISSFTTTACQAPDFVANVDIGATSARIYGSDSYSESGKTYQIRYRPVGTATWQVTSAMTTLFYTLTGLTSNTQYEWQVQGICSPTESSAFTPVKTFYTTCATPIGLFSAPGATGVNLNWYISYGESGTTYDLQFRVAGNPDWTTVSSLTAGFFSLTGLTPTTTYEWRVRTVCSATVQSNYSAIYTFTTVCNAPSIFSTSTQFITSSSVQLTWYQPVVDAGTPYDIRWRAIGASDWVVVTGLSTNSSAMGRYNLTGLANNTTYEWQIRTVCSPTQSSSFVAGPNFTTQCRFPDFIYQSVQITTAFLAWNQIAPDVSYDVRYRKTGAPDWTVVSSLTALNVSLTELTSNTIYEWQFRTQCSNGIYSDYSPVRTFQTNSCSIPVSLTTLSITSNSATLRWFLYYNATNTRYEIRWRRVDTPDWTTISDIAIGSALPDNFTLALTNLLSSTQYEWQIRTICSPSESSGFSNSVTFQTLPPCPSMYTVKTGSWADPSVWSCNRIPSSADDVQIKHVITVPADFAGNALKVHYDPGQKLIFGANARIKLGF